MTEIKGVIYKLYCKDPLINEIYVGSTIDLKRRIYQHKAGCKKNISPVYVFINDNGGWYNWTFKIIEEFIVENKKGLLERERYWYDILRPTLNKQRPAITYDELVEYQINFREQNKDKKNEYNKKYYTENKQYWIDYYTKKKSNVENITVTITFD